MIEDVRSEFNIGSMFRSADGLGWQHLCLVGISGQHRTRGNGSQLPETRALTWSGHDETEPYSRIESGSPRR